LKINKIKNRSVLFTESPDAWNLNIHLIMGHKYNYIIDTGLGSLSVDPVMDYIKNDNKKIIVINTHYHWDHIWGNGSLKDNIIVSHKLCRDLIETEWATMVQKKGNYQKGEVEMYLPSLVFEKELYFPEDKIRIIYTPGHTIDSISVIDEEEKVLNLGDNIGDDMDDIIPNLTCEKSIFRKTLIKYTKMDFDTCISGHNEVLGKEVIGKILSIL